MTEKGVATDDDRAIDRAAYLLTVARLTLGVMRENPEVAHQSDLDELYEALCEICELLGVEPLNGQHDPHR